jgi:hypothetical protein
VRIIGRLAGALALTGALAGCGGGQVGAPAQPVSAVEPAQQAGTGVCPADAECAPYVPPAATGLCPVGEECAPYVRPG